ncbi:MAG: hypothetical protein JW862_14210, partial [Anaerolineales bacterium]|nr:hypothetical protein [Anaerolineales bacterium]
TCFTCHGGADELTAIRISETDFDGDGDVTEGLAGEIATLTEALYAAMQAYTAANDATDGIVYASYAYPYYFADTNGNGEADRDEANYGNSYKTWTPNLLIAAYNYQYVLKDPGAFAHNGEYVIQVLIDTIDALGGDITLYTRPVVEAAE